MSLLHRDTIVFGSTDDMKGRNSLVEPLGHDVSIARMPQYDFRCGFRVLSSVIVATKSI